MKDRWARVPSQDAADWLEENMSGRYTVYEYDPSSWVKRGHARVIFFDNEVDKTWFLLRWSHESISL